MGDGPPVTLADVERARAALAGSIYLSPCAHSEMLSEMAGCEVYLKLENLQMTGSFKERGARNRLLALGPGERSAGVVTASAGNHAQGVAYHARALGIAATIVMPRSTPLTKVTATREFGAEVVLHGDSYDDAAAEARRLQRASGMVMIPAFDDDLVIAGQGTVGLELLDQVPGLQAVVGPIGGGGLMAGVGVALKGRDPSIGVYGVEASRIPTMQRALEAGTVVELPAARTIADGIAVRSASARTLGLAQRVIDRVVSVDEEELARAVLILIEREKTVAEASGAAALAGLLQGDLPLAGKRVAVIVSGGNIDVNLVARIIDRGLRRSGRSAELSVTLPDVPGALAGLLQGVAAAEANVLGVSHDRLGARIGVGLTRVQVSLETRGVEHITAVVDSLRALGYALDHAD